MLCLLYAYSLGHITNEEIIPRSRSYLWVKTSLLRCLPVEVFWAGPTGRRSTGQTQNTPEGFHVPLGMEMSDKMLQKEAWGCGWRNSRLLWKLLCFVCCNWGQVLQDNGLTTVIKGHIDDNKKCSLGPKWLFCENLCRNSDGWFHLLTRFVSH